MVKRYFVRTRDLQTGMRIDQDIQNSWGRSLIVRGSYLDEYQIEALKKLNINGVYIKEGEDDEDTSLLLLNRFLPSRGTTLPNTAKQILPRSVCPSASRKGFPRVSSICTATQTILISPGRPRRSPAI